MGADVVRTAPDTIEVHGRKRLRGADHAVVPDRIETGTFLVAAAVTGGQTDAGERGLQPRRRPGRAVRPDGRARRLRAEHDRDRRDGAAPGRPARDRHRDGAVPRPRDRHPAAGVRAPDPGRSAPPASTRRSSRTASSGWPSCASWAPGWTSRTPTTPSIHGPARLHGAEASIGDLRAGASLILAALAADGTSLIHGAHHVHRGYENIDRKFQQLGASITRSADPA